MLNILLVIGGTTLCFTLLAVCAMYLAKLADRLFSKTTYKNGKR